MVKWEFVVYSTRNWDMSHTRECIMPHKHMDASHHMQTSGEVQHPLLQYVAVCSSMLQHVAACCSVLQCVASCCNVRQCVSVCCSMLQCAAASYSVLHVLQHVTACCSVSLCVAPCCSMSQCVAACCSALQRVPACCRVLQWNMDMDGCAQRWESCNSYECVMQHTHESCYIRECDTFLHKLLATIRVTYMKKSSRARMSHLTNESWYAYTAPWTYLGVWGALDLRSRCILILIFLPPIDEVNLE